MKKNLSSLVLSGDRRAAARLLRLIDDQKKESIEELKLLYPHTGHSYIIGITGPPGSGKSVLINRLIELYRKNKLTVGVLAIDPSSPFTGGALLGDRIRMQQHSLDEGVFIRSIATRGHLGGLSKTTLDQMLVLEAMNLNRILIETVGVGQDEIEISKLAHSTIVVLSPPMGDEIQILKAGILEIGDIFVINKADLNGAENIFQNLKTMLSFKETKEWNPPIIKTISTKGKGIKTLQEAIEKHKRYIEQTQEGKKKKREIVRSQLITILKDILTEITMKLIQKEIDQIIDSVQTKKQDPYTEIQKILKKSRIIPN
jgi:LAO/AO transport system kinase